MEFTDYDLEQIESYFNQSLSEPDSKRFEERLQADAPFREAVNQYQATLAVLNTVRAREEKAFLKEIDATMPPYARPIFQLNYKWLPLAAAVLVIFWFGIHQFDGPKALKSPVAHIFELYPTYDTNKSGDIKLDKTAEAYRAYKAKEYKKASQLFTTAFDEKKDTILLFYKGIAELGSGKIQEAESDLEQLQNSNIVPQQALYFYMGLIAAEKG